MCTNWASTGIPLPTHGTPGRVHTADGHWDPPGTGPAPEPRITPPLMHWDPQPWGVTVTRTPYTPLLMHWESSGHFYRVWMDIGPPLLTCWDPQPGVHRTSSILGPPCSAANAPGAPAACPGTGTGTPCSRSPHCVPLPSHQDPRPRAHSTDAARTGPGYRAGSRGWRRCRSVPAGGGGTALRPAGPGPAPCGRAGPW